MCGRRADGECHLRVGDESRKLTFAQRQELHDDRGESHFDGKPLPGLTVQDLAPEQVAAFREAAELVDQWVPERRALGPDGRFTGVPLVPRDAWLEGLVNAVVHRSYSMAGDHVRVEIFPNRIEITSPGRFPGLVDTARPLDISRYARNPRLARICADLRIGQELGEGIRRMFREMSARGLQPPGYRQSSGVVHLTLSALKSIDDDVLAALPRGAESLLDVLRQAGHGRRRRALALPTLQARTLHGTDPGLAADRGRLPGCSAAGRPDVLRAHTPAVGASCPEEGLQGKSAHLWTECVSIK